MAWPTWDTIPGASWDSLPGWNDLPTWDSLGEQANFIIEAKIRSVGIRASEGVDADTALRMAAQQIANERNRK